MDVYVFVSRLGVTKASLCVWPCKCLPTVSELGCDRVRVFVRAEDSVCDCGWQ